MSKVNGKASCTLYAFVLAHLATVVEGECVFVADGNVRKTHRSSFRETTCRLVGED